jgi:hypothetical protein
MFYHWIALEYGSPTKELGIGASDGTWLLVVI